MTDYFIVANPKPTPTPRLSTVVDPKLFIAENLVSKDDDSVVLRRSLQCDDLCSSLQHVEPYPARPASKADMIALDTPAKRAIEGVYDRSVFPHISRPHILSYNRVQIPHVDDWCQTKRARLSIR